MKILPRALVATAFTLSLSHAAQAVPVYFDFTGTVFGSSSSGIEGVANGQLVSGGFNFETDRLVRSNDGGATAFLDLQPMSPALPLGSIIFPGHDVSLPDSGGSNYNFVAFDYGCDADVECTQGPLIGVRMAAYSSEFPEGDLQADITGTFHGSFLFLGAGFASPDPSIDSSNVDAYALRGGSLTNGFGVYSEETWNCLLGDCAFSARSFSFNLDSYSAGIASVPEPGTLGLMAIALGGMVFMRRRQTRRKRC